MRVTYIKYMTYPYSIDFTGIPVELRRYQVDDVQHWCDSIGIDCIITTTTGYFKHEKDTTIFILKYAA